jgi:hypothetical protein
LIAVLSLPAFYWMMRQYSESRPLALGSLIVFTLMPESFSNQIVAAGLAEAFGLLAIVLYLGWLFRFERKPGWANAVVAGVLLGSCVLSSPGSAYAAAILSVLFFAKLVIAGFRSRSFEPAAWLLLTALVGLLVSAPYWLTVISRFGADLFIRSFAAQHRDHLASRLRDIAHFSVSGGQFGFIWSWLALAGFLWAALNRRWFVPLMLMAFWPIPREGGWLVSVPASMLAGTGLVEVVGPMLQKVFPRDRRSHPDVASAFLLALLAALALVGAASSDQVNLSEFDRRLPPRWLAALAEMRVSLPPDASVVVPGDSPALREWAPALLEREVLNTPYGLEWQPEELPSVNAIDDALQAHDLARMLFTAQHYGGKPEIYLIVPPRQLRDLLAGASTNISVTPIIDKGPLTLTRLGILSE